MTFEDWLFRKQDQYAHDEILAFLTMILGMNFFIGGLIVTANVTQGLFFISKPPLLSLIGFTLSVTGIFVLLSGFFLLLYYDRKRAWHVGELEKANKRRNRKHSIGIIQAEEMLKERSESRHSE